MRERWPRLLAATVLASFVFAPLSAASAQAGLGHVDDAGAPPRGLLRFRAITAFTRSDSRFTTTGVEPLGAPYSADSLGPRHFTPLSDIQSLVQSASGNPFTLSLGRSRFDATAREEIVPLGLEYGIADRLAVGVIVPIVRKRIAAQFLLDSTGANVGPNPARTNAAARQINDQVQAEFANARALLDSRLQSCQANPSGAGCAALLARQTEAQALLSSSQAFALLLSQLYGSSSVTGMAFVPTSQSAPQADIALRVADFNSQYQDLLATGTTLIQAVPRAAGGPAGSAEFQRYVTEDLGRDSLLTQERVGIGDIEVGFRLRLLDLPTTETRRAGIGLTLVSAVRLPTGSRQSPSDVYDLRLGDGSVIVDSRAMLDARLGRLGVLAGGQFATSVRNTDTTNSAMRNSRWMELTAATRWHLSEPFAVHGAYSFRSTDKLGDDQLVGGGVSFSTLSAYRRGVRGLPTEMRFTHLQTISGDAGRPSFFRDQIEVRIYFRLR
jgi:hypothetical protein